MNIAITISTISYITYIYFGFYVFFKDPRSWTNRFFLAFSLSIAVWCFCITWLNFGVSEASKHIWQKAAFVGAMPYSYFILVCFLNLTGYINRIKNKKLFYIALLIVPSIYIYKVITANIMFELPQNSFWFYSAHIYSSVYSIIAASILFIWGLKTKYKRIKKQVAVIIYPGIALLIFTLLLDFYIERDQPYRFTSATLLIWYCFAGYAIVRYNFLEINIKQAANDIISNIDEHLVLMNDCFYIKYIKRSLSEELGIILSNYINHHISGFINEYEDLVSEMKKMNTEDIKDFSCRLHLLDTNQNKVLYDTKIKMLKDKFNDVTGYLMVCKKIRDVSYLEKTFNITKRENDIIQKIYEGKTNKEIAEELFISERTVKSHLVNIFMKMSVNNRTKLISTLQDMNLAPSIPSQKTLFLSLKKS